jgi:hypothetical protein
MFLTVARSVIRESIFNLALMFIAKHKRFFSHLRLDRESMVSVNFGSVVGEALRG